MSSHRGVVVVTGASTGIGRACALHLDGLGFDVYAGVRDPDDGAQLKAEASDRLAPLALDVTDPDAIAAAAERVSRETGDAGVAGLVNNAGIAVSGALECLPIDSIRRQMEVNTIAPLSMAQAFLPQLRSARGRIVNIGSVGGRLGFPFIAPYQASKAGIASLTASLRRELRPWGIWVALVEPGAIATPIWKKGARDADDGLAGLSPEEHALYGSVLSRMGELSLGMERIAIPPERVAKRVAHALTARRPRARYMLGRDARPLATLSALLPDRTFDRVIAARLGW